MAKTLLHASADSLERRMEFDMSLPFAADTSVAPSTRQCLAHREGAEI
jgi:hypothetical protein